MTTTRRARLATAAVATVGLMTGCGVAGTDFQPGVAAEVDGRTISSDRVDEAVTAYCDFLVANPNPEQVAAGRFGYRSELVAILVLRSATEQAAAEAGVEPGSDYTAQVAELERGLAELPEDQREALVTVNEAQLYGASTQTALGEALLSEEGVVTVDPAEAEARGGQAVAEWIETHDIEISPEYGLELDGSELTATDQHLSFAAGEQAAAGQAAQSGQPDPAYVESLPASQRCG